ncbi:MAG: hypothetical protein OSB21_03680 [Myxococcota bacterium]|nr:hypothetical protein [Myxococcota bacterium]
MTVRVPLVVASCDFRQSGSRARAQLALSAEEQGSLFDELKRQGVHGLVVLHTCNRVEWWVSCQDPQWAEHLLAAAWRLRLKGKQERPSPRLLSGEMAAEHLFRVSVGLESLVQGERGIWTQVRQALRKAQTSRNSAPAMNIIANSAGLLAAKVRQGMTPQAVTKGMHSLAARRIDQVLRGEGRVLVVGMGEIGRRCADLIEARGYTTLRFNRSVDAANTYRSLEQLPSALASASALIFCSSAPEPLLGPGQLPENSKTLVIDLSSPAQVEHSVAVKLGGNYLGLDELAASSGVHLEQGEVERLQGLVAESMDDYLARLAHHRFGGLARSNQRHLEQVVNVDLPDLLDRLAGDLPLRERRSLEAALRKLFRSQASVVRQSLVEAFESEPPAQLRLPDSEIDPC